MRAAFSELGLEPLDVPLDRAVLADHPGAAPFSWDVAGKSNVVATWEPAAPADGRSLILNGHIDVVSPEPVSLWSSAPFTARRDGDWLYGRGAGDMKSGLAAMVGALRGLRRLGPRAAWPGRAAVGRRGGVHRQRRARMRARGPYGRRRDPDRADARRDLARAGRRALVPGPRDRPARTRRRRGRRRQRDRGVDGGDRGAARARGRVERRQAAALRRLSAPDQPERRHDPRRRLALDGRGRVPDALPARAVSRRARGRPEGPRRARPSPRSARSWATSASRCSTTVSRARATSWPPTPRS